MSPKERYAQRLVVVKVGGEILAVKERREQLVQNLADWKDTFFILVQGGGPQIDKATGRREFKAGLRKTASSEISIIHEVYYRSYEKLRQEFIDAGCGSIHVWGNHGLLWGERADGLGETGHITKVDDDFMPDKLRVRRFFGIKLERPIIVVSPLAKCGPFQYLNVNADEAAMCLAKHFKANALVFLSTSAVLDSRGHALERMDPEAMGNYKRNPQAYGEIRGGMRVKVGAALMAAESVPRVVIADGRRDRPLTRALEDGGGTEVKAKGLASSWG